jgi:DNA-binding response OmpR family regulator
LIFATRGDNALPLVHDSAPDLILLDAGLPFAMA